MVLDQQHRDADVADARNHLNQLLRFLWVETGGGLVEQQQLGMRGQRTRQLEAALQTIGQIARDLERLVAQVQTLKNLQRLIACALLRLLRLAHANQAGQKARVDVRVQAHLDVVEHRHVAEQAQVLERASQTHARNLVGRHADNLTARKHDGAALGRDDARENIQQRGLARTVRSDQRMHMAGANLDVDIVGRHHTTVGFVQAVTLEQNAGVRSTRGRLQLPCRQVLRQWFLGNQAGRKLARQLAHKTGQSIRHGIEREQQQRAVGEVLHVGPAREHRVEQRQHHRTEQRTIDRVATEQHHQQEEDRQVEVDEVRVDVLVLLSDQRARDAAGERTDHKGQHLELVDAHAHAFGRHFGGVHGEERAPETASQQIAEHHVQRHAQDQHKPDPLLGAEHLATDLQRNHAVDALLSGKHVLPFGDDLLDHDAEADRHHRQRRPLHAQRRQRDDHAEDGGHDTGHRKRGPGVPRPARGEQGHRIGTDREQARMAQRFLAGVVHQHVQTRGGDVVHADQEQHAQIEVVARHERHGRGQCGHDDQPTVMFELAVHHQTFSTIFCPSSP